VRGGGSCIPRTKIHSHLFGLLRACIRNNFGELFCSLDFATETKVSVISRQRKYNTVLLGVVGVVCSAWSGWSAVVAYFCIVSMVYRVA
jgi:hypothetical protein